MARRSLVKRLGIGCLAIVVIIAGLIAFTEPGKALQDLWEKGVIQGYLTPDTKRTYTADNEKNLKAIYTALMLYHDSEGQFPVAGGWMDAIEPRIRADDMSSDEAKKKLIRPGVSAGQFGYAMNDAASGKYKDDVKPSTTPLIYESKQTVRNAHGDPAKDRDGMAIAVDGTILKP